VLGVKAEPVGMRQFFGWAKACSQAARSTAINLLTCFFAVARGLVRAALNPVMITGLSGASSRPVKPRSAIPGDEFSVESITQHGVTTHLCITRKDTTSGINRVEVGHALPVRLLAPTERALLEQTQRARSPRSASATAPTHIELVLSPDGRCTVLEIGARLGAGHIGVPIQHALGINPWRALWDIALGELASLTPQARNYATVRFLTTPQAGRLVAVTGLPPVTTTIPAVGGHEASAPAADIAAAADQALTGNPSDAECAMAELLTYIAATWDRQDRTLRRR
jgi:Biotin carboxylase